MNNVLVIEPSATQRRALERLLETRGMTVSGVPDYETGLSALALERWSAVVLGCSTTVDGAAKKLLETLAVAGMEDTAVLVLSHEAHPRIFEWVAQRPHSALLQWADYVDSAECLERMLGGENGLNGSKSVPEAPEPSASITRVLFVDDSRTARAKFKRLLREEGYMVQVAANATEALDKARSTSFDIAIIDYFMPGGNGDELCRRLKENADTDDITVALLTGTYLDEVIRSALDAGAVECMFKNEADALFLARVAAMSRAVHDRKSIEGERRRLERILSSVGDGVYGVDTDGYVTFINPAAKKILGLSPEQGIIGKSAHKLFHYAHEDGKPNPEETCFLQQAYRVGDELHSWQTIFWNHRGDPFPVECTVYPLKVDSRLQGSVVAFRDIAERKLLEQELMWQANHDPLTELYNRNYFERQLGAEVNRRRRSKEASALLYIDLDRFKYINDTAGHAAGDELLMEISRQLTTRLRESDILARLGGDEFAIILSNVDGESVQPVADSFREVLEQYQFVYAGKQYPVNGSIGVAIIDNNSRSPGEVLANADIACHIAKNRGRNQTHVYHPQDQSRVVMTADLGWSERLQRALAGKGFELFYQPIAIIEGLDISNGPRREELWPDGNDDHKVPHYEVLLRYRDEAGKTATPNVFLSAAERFGLMPQIDRWVFHEAIKSLKQSIDKGRQVMFSVNLSGESLNDEDLANTLRELLAGSTLPPGSLVIEVKETSAVANLDAARRLMLQLRELGCRFALDDFGSGFSSFYHLKHLPVDYIKIDGQLIRNMEQSAADRAIVNAINQIAHAFGKRTIAQTVESAKVLELLRKEGVDCAQGHAICEPQAELLAVAS